MNFNIGLRLRVGKQIAPAEKGEMNYVSLADIWDGKTQPLLLPMKLSTLVLFEGLNPMNRVTPIIGQRIPIFPVLGYNVTPGIAL